jgi:MoaA/NifB/PqqE/SkfB family radical SAM enzyme
MSVADSTLCDSGSESLGDLFGRIRERMPLRGTLELTRRCNLRCVHCYAATGSAGRPELSSGQWNEVLEQIAQAGCLTLLFTGGEPLLRSDFAALYERARRLGLLLTVFTNGTRVTPDHCGLFQLFPPRNVEISLYGATEATYEAVTRVPGSFRQCVRGIERLLGHGIPLVLKTCLLRENVHEHREIRAMAASYGVKFRMDAAIIPRLNGDREPLLHRVLPETGVDCEFAEAKHVETLAKYCQLRQDIKGGEGLYRCGSAKRSFFIGATGWLQGCLLADEVRYDMTQGAFAEGWTRVLPRLWDIPAPADYRCANCKERVVCSICPPAARLEGGDAGAACDFFCRHAKERWNRLKPVMTAMGSA